MNYEEIKDRLLNVEIICKVKDYSKNNIMLDNYYEIGRLIYEEQGGESRAKYGDNLIKEYSKKLTLELGKRYNERTFRRMRQFYILFKDKNWSTLSTKLTWSHYTELLKFKDINKINYYINTITQQNLIVRELRNRIKNNVFIIKLLG